MPNDLESFPSESAVGKFMDPLHVEFLDGHGWRLLKSFDYHLGAPDGSERVVVPAGFVTDFASVPRGLWNLLPPTGPYGKSAVIHDYLYQHRLVRCQFGAVGEFERVRLVERDEADEIFHEGMIVLGVRRLVRLPVYVGIRVGGWWAWSRYRATDSARPH